MSRNPSPMLSFLIRCAQQSHLDELAHTLEEPPFLAEPAAWPRFFALAREMGLLLPACVAINKAKWKSALPEAVLKSFDLTLKNELIAMAVLENEFENVLRRLIQFKVGVIVLAGSILQRDTPAEEAFKSVRHFDVLVPREQMTSALHAIGKMGYRLEPADDAVGGQGFSRRLQSAVSGENVVSHLRFRWRVLEEDRDHDAAAIWERAQPRVSAEFPQGLKALTIEDKLVQLIRHGLIEDRLRTPSCLNEMDHWIRSQPSLDWVRVLFMLERSQALSAGACAMSLLQKHWHSPIPKNVHESLVGRLGTLKRRTLAGSLALSHWFVTERDWATSMRLAFLLGDDTILAIKQSFRPRPQKAA